MDGTRSLESRAKFIIVLVLFFPLLKMNMHFCKFTFFSTTIKSQYSNHAPVAIQGLSPAVPADSEFYYKQEVYRPTNVNHGISHNSSSTGKVDLDLSSRRHTSTELKVAYVHPSFGIISDNLKTCIRCFDLSHGASIIM